MEGMGQDEMQEILDEFFTEADEGLASLEGDLIKLEADASDGEMDGELVDRLFRVLHTLKGGAGFLGLEKMARLAHFGENLLDEIRAENVPVTTEVMDALLQSNDMLQEILNVHKSGEEPEDIDITELANRLEQLVEKNVSQAVETPAVEEPTPSEPEAPAEAPAEPPASVEVNEDLLKEVMSNDDLDPSKDKDNPQNAAPAESETPAEPPASVEVNEDLLKEVMSNDDLDPSKDKDNPQNATPAKPEVPAEAPATEAPDPAPVEAKEPEEVVVKRGDKAPERRDDSDRRQNPPDRRKGPRRVVEKAETTIRVETGRLDKVMNLVGELVLARNSLIRQLTRENARRALEGLPNHGAISSNLESLSRATRDLQMSVLGTRMQPIKKVFDKIPRQVRELKSRLGKEVELVVEGEMTEVDKTLVEELSDPMVHLVRNSLDHGLETPEERREMGKNEVGRLEVKAFYEGNSVIITVSDDGNGIDPVKIKGKAIEKGLISESAAKMMSDQEAVRLILAPGFSTAEEISDVSGRGVGMDVVNSKINDVKGTLDIRSEFGKGTTIRINLPLTLAIMQALLVEASEEGFAIPIGDISEVIKYKPAEINKLNDKDVIELRGQVLPLFYLGELSKDGKISLLAPPELQEKAAEIAAQNADAEAEAGVDAKVEVSDASDEDKPSLDKGHRGYIIVVREGASNIGVVVDELIGQEEAVVKPITKAFEYNKAISGATITGDGRVHMILDVPYLVKDLGSAASSN